MTAPTTYSTSNMADYIGHEFTSVEAITVDQGRINGFADSTGDHQWIHTDVERAQKEGPFGGPIAHGFLTLSLLAADAQTCGVIPNDAKAALNYGLGKVRFLTPVPAGAKVQASYKILSVEPKDEGRNLVTIESVLKIAESDKPAVIAELIAMIIA